MALCTRSSLTQVSTRALLAPRSLSRDGPSVFHYRVVVSDYAPIHVLRSTVYIPHFIGAISAIVALNSA